MGGDDQSTTKERKRFDELAEEFIEIERKKSIAPNPETEAFNQRIVKQAERFDDLAKELLKIELIVPGIYYFAAIGKVGNISLDNGTAYAAFALWLCAIGFTLSGLYPKRYRVRKSTRSRSFFDKPISEELRPLRRLLIKKKGYMHKRVAITTFLLDWLERLPEQHQKKALNRVISRPLTLREYFAAKAKRTYRYFMGSTLAFILGVIFAGLAMGT